jgi:nicotinate-nucleotide adenylyltransferase
VSREQLRTAVFGGTFDPVHIGHLLMAEEVLFHLGYERILFVPTRVPPHKSTAPEAGSEDRLVMLTIATSENPAFVVDPVEIERDEVSYTVDTIRYLLESGRIAGRPGLIIGEDLVAGFDRWREADELERLTDIIVLRRPHETESELRFPRRHTVVENAPLGVSASGIRARVREGRPYRYLVPRGVYDYIEANALYL